VGATFWTLVTKVGAADASVRLALFRGATFRQRPGAEGAGGGHGPYSGPGGPKPFGSVSGRLAVRGALVYARPRGHHTTTGQTVLGSLRHKSTNTLLGSGMTCGGILGPISSEPGSRGTVRGSWGGGRDQPRAVESRDAGRGGHSHRGPGEVGARRVIWDKRRAGSRPGPWGLGEPGAGRGPFDDGRPGALLGPGDGRGVPASTGPTGSAGRGTVVFVQSFTPPAADAGVRRGAITFSRGPWPGTGKCPR